MLVMKFGGTSVGSADAISKVIRIVSKALDRRPVVVCSAHSGVTDLLVGEAEKAAQGKGQIDAIAARHRRILADLNLDPGLLDEELEELRQLIYVVSLLGELTQRTKDRILSFGERMSCKAIAAAFDRAGYRAAYYPAWELGLVTDSQFGGARPTKDSARRMADALAALDPNVIPVITGYVARSESGQITTLGRGGSDYSAALFGGAGQAEEVQIWTDVSGVMTADPRMVSQAMPLPVLSFAEASELATFGAKVLHPATMLPAMEKGIPIRVLNTFKPEDPGTLIVEKTQATASVVKSIASKSHVNMLDIVSSRMLGQAGFLVRIAEVFASCKISVDVIASSEVSVSVSVESGDEASLQRAMGQLSDFARVKHYKGLGQICIVGEGMRETAGVAAKAFTALGDRAINIVMISQGASQINLTVIVDGSRTVEAVRALHACFFEKA